MSDMPLEPSNTDFGDTPDSVRHWAEYWFSEAGTLQARAEKAEAELREARMQMLSDAGQAAEAYEAQLKAEAACDAVMKDRAYIMAERDKTFALMLERAENAEAQVERMREALQSIIKASSSTRPGVHIARTALGRYMREKELAARVRTSLAGDAP